MLYLIIFGVCLYLVVDTVVYYKKHKDEIKQLLKDRKEKKQNTNTKEA